MTTPLSVADCQVNTISEHHAVSTEARSEGRLGGRDAREASARPVSTLRAATTTPGRAPVVGDEVAIEEVAPDEPGDGALHLGEGA